MDADAHLASLTKLTVDTLALAAMLGEPLRFEPKSERWKAGADRDSQPFICLARPG